MRFFDLHCDTLFELSSLSGRDNASETLLENNLQVDLQRAKQFDHYAQIFALFCGAEPIQSPEDAHTRLLCLLETAKKQFAMHDAVLLHCKTAEDFKKAQEQHKTAAFLSIEGAELVQTETDLRMVLDFGIKVMTLTWNHDSIYGCGALTDNTARLKPAGIRLAERLSEAGVILDVSHLSERGFWQLADCIKTPIIATHSNSRNVCKHLRNLTDNQFRAILRRKGVVGINLYVPFLNKRNTADCDDIIGHIEHFCALGGEKNLCIGADWDGCDRMPEGISDVTGIALLAEALAKRNYSDTLIRDLFYDNAARFVEEYF